jgi:PPIC-type PPIASE domain
MKVLRDPLLHFLLVGAGLFLALGLTGRLSRDEPGRIVITQGQVRQLAAGFDRLHRRPPSPEEMDALIRNAIQEEVYYREAITLGLDRDDAVIRQRLRQKMEFISDDVASMSEPTDEHLRAYLHEHSEAFRIAPRVSFTHVYLDPARRRDRLARDAAEMLAQLDRADAAVDVSTLGDPFLLAHRFDEVSSREVAALFGDGFAAELSQLTPGRWRGPIESGYGLHLVSVSQRWEGRIPGLEDVRDAVRREWVAAHRQQANEQLFTSLLERYAVTVEHYEVAGTGDAWAAGSSR